MCCIAYFFSEMQLLLKAYPLRGAYPTNGHVTMVDNAFKMNKFHDLI